MFHGLLLRDHFLGGLALGMCLRDGVWGGISTSL